MTDALPQAPQVYGVKPNDLKPKRRYQVGTFFGMPLVVDEDLPDRQWIIANAPCPCPDCDRITKRK